MLSSTVPITNWIADWYFASSEQERHPEDPVREAREIQDEIDAWKNRRQEAEEEGRFADADYAGEDKGSGLFDVNALTKSPDPFDSDENDGLSRFV